MEWISIKDRLPDERDIYLVYSDGQIALGDFVLEEQIWNVQPYCNSWYWSKSMVTHWMPLPEPPKKPTITVIINVQTEEKRKMTEDEWADFIHESVKRAISHG
jgi:hypothetical protein